MQRLLLLSHAADEGKADPHDFDLVSSIVYTSPEELRVRLEEAVVAMSDRLGL